MRSDIFINHIGTALYSWLSYITSVERKYVLAENSVKYPVSEFIGTKIHPDKIYLDKEHPDLKNRYLDLRFFIDSFEDFDNSEFEVAIEFKYSRFNYTEKLNEKKRIFNDIMRLKLFIESSPKRKAYFLICGPQYDFIKSFQSIGWNDDEKNNNNGLPYEDNSVDSNYFSSIEPKGFYTNWFKFNKGESQHIDLSSTVIPFQKIYKSFLTDYKDAYEDKFTENQLKQNNPITKAIYISETSDLLDIPTPMKVGIWEILIDNNFD